MTIYVCEYESVRMSMRICDNVCVSIRMCMWVGMKCSCECENGSVSMDMRDKPKMRNLEYGIQYLQY